MGKYLEQAKKTLAGIGDRTALEAQRYPPYVETETVDNELLAGQILGALTIGGGGTREHVAKGVHAPVPAVAITLAELVAQGKVTKTGDLYSIESAVEEQADEMP